MRLVRAACLSQLYLFPFLSHFPCSILRSFLLLKILPHRTFSSNKILLRCFSFSSKFFHSFLAPRFSLACGIFLALGLFSPLIISLLFLSLGLPFHFLLLAACFSLPSLLSVSSLPAVSRSSPVSSLPAVSRSGSQSSASLSFGRLSRSFCLWGCHHAAGRVNIADSAMIRDCRGCVRRS